MQKFMYVYYDGSSKSEMANLTDEIKEKVMADWKAYGEKLGDNLIDLGNPFGPAKVVTADSKTDAEGNLKGYSIIQAEDMESAVALTENHPHLSEEGGIIEVYPIFDM